MKQRWEKLAGVAGGAASHITHSQRIVEQQSLERVAMVAGKVCEGLGGAANRIANIYS